MDKIIKGIHEMIRYLSFFIGSVVNTNPNNPFIPHFVFSDFTNWGINIAWIISWISIYIHIDIKNITNFKSIVNCIANDSGVIKSKSAGFKSYAMYAVDDVNKKANGSESNTEIGRFAGSLIFIQPAF